MTKTFAQHAAEAQMDEADRIAHAATWEAAIQAAAEVIANIRWGYDGDCGAEKAILTLATE